jgi:Immunity protein 35
MVLSEDEAKVIALNQIERMAQGSVPLGLLDSATQAGADGWLFFYQSVEFLETHQTAARLAGNGPIFVHHSGRVHILPSHQPPQQSLDAIRSDATLYLVRKS